MVINQALFKKSIDYRVIVKKKMKSKYRKSVFLVVYARGKKISYLLLKRKLHWRGWEFPKGGIEKNEKIGKAVKRELQEETGLKAVKIIKFNLKGKFDYGRELPDRLGIRGQTWKLFAVEVKKGKIKIDREEHSAFKWLNFKQAYNKLTWQNQKRCLRIVDRKLNK